MKSNAQMHWGFFEGDSVLEFFSGLSRIESEERTLFFNLAIAWLATHASKFVINPSAFVIVKFVGTFHVARAMVD